MKIRIFNVVFHNFEPVKEKNNVVLGKCTCCLKSRWSVYVLTSKSKIFYYHGNDEAYAQKIFSSLVSRFNSQQQT